MKSLCPWLAVIALTLAGGTFAQAQPYYGCSPALQRPLGQAPDACGPGFYTWYYGDGIYGYNWTTYGPGYALYPPFPPFQGYAPQPRGQSPAQLKAMAASLPQLGQGPQNQQVIFPTHPYNRSPRDFFMWTEAQEDLLTRDRLPRFVP